RAGSERAVPRRVPEGRGERRAPRRAGAERVRAMAKKNLLDPIPHPPRTFVLGNLLSLTTTTPVQDMMKLAREYGPIYWLDMLGKRVVIAPGFELVDEPCDEARFDKSVRGALRRLRAFAGDGLFTAYTQEPNWAKAHNILLPSFAQRAMQGYHPMM